VKRLLAIIPLILILGCTSSELSIGLEVPFHTTGCSGFEESFSDVTVAADGLHVISNIISDNPCYKLNKAEISRDGDDVTVYFTFSRDATFCSECIGVQSLIYRITGEGLNRTGVNVEVVGTLVNQEVSHNFTS